MIPARVSDSDLRAIDDLFSEAGLSHTPGNFSDRPQRQAGQKSVPQPCGLPSTSEDKTERAPTRREFEVLRVPSWSGRDWLLHGFSTRGGGVSTAYASEESPDQSPEQSFGELNLGLTASDARENVLENRRRFVEAVAAGRPLPSLVTLKQIHSSLVRVVGHEDSSEAARWKADGMMTAEPGVLLAIQTADCIPILVADVKTRAVAAFHAGWRGTLRRIVETGIGNMRLAFGSRPEDLIAAIGPGIGSCCYAVGEEVRNEFESQFHYASELFHEVSSSDPVREKYPLLFLTARAPGHSNLGQSLHLDLMEANRRQLLDAGVPSAAISVTGECTRCLSDKYFSYRADHGFTGRMLSAVGVA
jgi:YfiH family protein